MDFALIQDWLGREGGYVLSWWLLVTLAGLAVWPLLYRFMGGLPDRGYTLARAAGLMLIGFVYWFLGSLGLLRNTPGGMVFCWVLVLALGLLAFLRWEDRPPLREWFQENKLLIVVTEVVFLVLLFGWAIYRAHNPEVASTEKPMEIMFLNGIRRSETFPPHDPWLSGYAISYYYFGYVIMAMLADLSGVSSGIAFGIMIALLFALTGIGALGIAYNMVRLRGSRGAAVGAGILALCFVILMGNLGTVLVELPYRGYTPGLVNRQYFDFWDVEDRPGSQTVIDELGRAKKVPVDSDGDTVPNWDDTRLPFSRWDFWTVVGWRYSRVVQDRDLNGVPIGVQPIAETPIFSFVLSDLHPHVLALPFAVLAIGLALNLVLNRRSLLFYEYPLYAIWVGGMMFMNSWDVVYVLLLVGAEGLRLLLQKGRLSIEDAGRVIVFALVIAGLAAGFYLPWLLSFTSQASGILPNVIFPTRWQQYFLQFGTFLVILSIFVLVEVWRAGRRFNWSAAVLSLVSALGMVAVVATSLGWAAWNSVDVRGAVYQAVGPVHSLRDIMPDILSRRLTGLPTELLLLVLMCLVVGRLFARPVDNGTPSGFNFSPATAFALLMVGAGAGLTFIPDFAYLHDNFGVRINTVFKLYYQGWLFFSLASAFAVWSILSGTGSAWSAGRVLLSLSRTERWHKNAGVFINFLRGYLFDPLLDLYQATRIMLPALSRIVFGTVALIFFTAGMVYPVLAAQSRALVDTGRLCSKTGCPEKPPLTLDGTPTMIPADEYAAIQCLNKLVQGDQAVLLEAPGGAYQPNFDRFSGLTGIPTLMGWQNHEGQWRGKTYPEVTDQRIEDGQLRDRITDAQEVYTTQDWDRVWQIIDRYGIDYIIVGHAEHKMVEDMAGGNASLLYEYNMGLDKFGRVLQPICGDTIVYRVAPN